MSFRFFNRDHLGNVREVLDEKGDVLQVNNYYPFGTPIWDLCVNAGYQKLKFGGKEFDATHGLNAYDFGARQYDPVLARWDKMDPMAEKYPYVSPYAYCLNNPVNSIDKDGKEVIISGELNYMALNQLQAMAGNGLLLYLNENNYLCYNISDASLLRKNSRKMVKMIDDNNIVVNIKAKNTTKTSTGNLLIGGAFMGNVVELDEEHQTINVFPIKKLILSCWIKLTIILPKVLL